MSCGCNEEFIGHYGHAIVPIVVDQFTPINGSALAQDEAIVAATMTLPCFFRTDGGRSEIVQIDLLEEADGTANIKQAALRASFFNADPGAPGTGALVLDDSKEMYTALFKSGAAAAETPYQGYARVDAQHRRATIKPGVVVSGVTSDAYLWILADGAVTFHSSGRITPIVWVRHHV